MLSTRNMHLQKTGDLIQHVYIPKDMLMFPLILILIFGCSKGATDSGTCEETRQTVRYNSTYPKTTKEYDNISKEMNCMNIPQNCTSPENFRFHTVISPYKNDTMFVCAPEKKIVGGYCPEYNLKGGRVQQNYGAKCSGFSFKPCPIAYLSSDAYKYPLCFEKYGKPADICSRDPLTIPYVRSKMEEMEEKIKVQEDSFKHLLKLVENGIEVDIKDPSELFGVLDRQRKGKNEKLQTLQKKTTEQESVMENQETKIDSLVAAVVIFSVLILILILSICYQKRKKLASLYADLFKDKDDEQEQEQSTPDSQNQNTSLGIDSKADSSNPHSRVGQRKFDKVQADDNKHEQQEDEHSVSEISRNRVPLNDATAVWNLRLGIETREVNNIKAET